MKLVHLFVRIAATIYEKLLQTCQVQLHNLPGEASPVHCGYSNISGAAFCENCGNPLSQEASLVSPQVTPQETTEQEHGQFGCGNCSHQNVPGSKYCENCGSELSQPAPVAPPQVTPQPSSMAQPEPPAHPAPVTGDQVCSQCGFSNPHGTSFCGNCGLLLTEGAQPPSISEPAVPEPAVPEPSAVPVPPVLEEPISPAPIAAPIPIPAGITGSIEVKKSGELIPIPVGKSEVIIGREDPVSGIFPAIDLDPHGGHDSGVGRKHARLFVQNDQLMVEDQDSVNGTFVNKHKLNAFQPHPLTDGDEVRLGKIILIYHA